MITALLRSLYTEHLHWPAEEDRQQALLADAAFFSLSSYLYHELKRSGQWSRLPAYSQGALKNKADRVLYHSLLIRRELSGLLARFEEAGVRVIPLKGVRLAERFFGHAAARQTSDIDLLVPPDEMERAVACAHAAGFLEKDELEIHHISYYKNLGGRKLGVELHHSIGFETTADIDIPRLWERSEPADGFAYVRELPLQETFYTLCLHGLKDRMTYKHLIDIAHLLEHYGEELRWEELWRTASREGTRRRLLTALALVYRLYPQMGERYPLPDKAPAVFWSERLVRDYMRKRQNAGYYAYLLLFPLLYMDTAKQRAAHLRHVFLPPRTAAPVQHAGRRGTGRFQDVLHLYKYRVSSLLKRRSP
ncbi:MULTISPECIES: nucleotidyltransferase domain-containing protein [Paenibacillus]|uniref:nucleotidyltransferase domain-containing protein n=1 Tax=Paenibacillus TaxID=44249 RepID=UPI0022B8C6E2|nr:nucleotidyltransferase family protein [Paenibacillus caseinilyticus]MCZ8522137.1 nucleotidyltransferase family protein [Paenibacillus caseinilyticus]